MTLTQLKQIQAEHNYTLIAGMGDNLYTSWQDGIKPILSKLAEKKYYFENSVIVDRVVGKAAAMLFVRSKVGYVHANVLSRSAQKILDHYQVSYSFDILVDYIKNRNNTGMCPMEETVLNVEDLDEAFQLLLEKQKLLVSAAKTIVK